MGIIKNYPKQKIISDESLAIGSIKKAKQDYYKNIIRYLDENLYFNYLKSFDPFYGLNFSIQLPYYIKMDVGVSIAIIIYQKKYPEDGDLIDPLKLLIVEENIKHGIYI